MTQTGPTVVVTGLTAARMLEIENESVTGGLVNANGELILSTRGGTEIDAGVVKGPQGDPGAQGIQGEQGIQGPKGDNSMPAGSITLWASDVAPANWLICDGSAVSRVTYASLFAAIGTKYGVGDGTTTFNLPNLNGKAPVGKDDAQTEFNALGKTGGEKTHILTATEMPSHTHVQNSHNHVVISDVVAASGHTHGLSTAYADVLLAAVSSNQLALRRFTTPTWTPTHSYTLGSVGAGAYSTPSTVGTQLGGNTDPPDTTSRVGLSATTGTNQNTGGDGAHNNLQPYSVVNFIIKTSNGDTEGDSQLTQRVNSLEVDRTPAGSVNVFSGAAAPLGWLLCDGSAVSRTTYAKLFAVIGTTYGAGDGSTTFAVPNLKGKVVVGVDGAQAEFNTLGETGGEKTHKLTAAEMPSHTHTQNAHNHNQDPHNHIQDPHNHFANTASPGATGTRYADSANGMAHTIYGAMATPTNQETTATNQATTATNNNTGGDGAHNNLQPYLVMNYIIKT